MAQDRTATLKAKRPPENAEQGSTGTVSGTVKNLVSGKTYDLTATFFARDYATPWGVYFAGPDPEESGGQYSLQIHFDVAEPATGSYELGSAGFAYAVYARWPSEAFYTVESGVLDLKNFVSVRHLEGDLKAITLGRWERKYELNLKFSIMG
jgi:hypothetical protein